MFVLGLIVLAAAVVGSVELIIANTQPVTLHMWGWTWHFDAFWLAVCGAVLITAAWLGLGAMRIAAVHQMRIRREHKELAAENERLAARVKSAEPADAKTHRPMFGRNRPAQPQQYAAPVTATAPPAAAPAPPAPAQAGPTSGEVRR